MRKSTALLLAALCLAPFAQAQNTIAGNLTVQQTVKLTGAASPAQLTASVNDYAPAGFSTASVLRLQSDVPRTITGLAGGVAGRMVWLTNVGSQPISLATESASSMAANRFAFGASGFDLPAGGSLSIWYDTTSSRWRSATNLAAGGGGTSIDQTARDAAAAAQATADSKQAALANAGTLAKVTEAAGLPLWNGAAWPGGGSGSGTVTSVAVTAANGVSATIANPNTTPTLTFSLGAVTPSSVAATGNVTGANLTGTNTGDQSDATLTFSDMTTNNVSTARHGFAPKLPNDAAKYLDGTGTWSTPAGGGGGSGTVTSVSVVTANGVSGSVVNATTTPAITLSLGAIAPTSVAASGTVTGSNLSGTNTGDQTSVTGNAGTATKLATARAINGVSFDGTSAITVPAAAGTLTGTTLASGVTASSLTSAAGGSFGTAAFTASTAYDSAGAAAAITLAGLGGVPTSRTVNGHALSGNVTVTPSDLSLAIGTNTQAWSAKLDAVAALAATNGWLHNDGAGVLAWSTPSKSDVGLGAVENTALSAWSGSANLATVGTVTAGTWAGSAIADAYISSAAAWNAKVSFPGFGTTAGTAAEGNDARLSDARTPTAHNQAWSTITSTPTTLSGYGITNAQGLDADLTAIASNSSNGLWARTGAGTGSARTITGTANQITVTNGDGVSGNPTLSLPQSIATGSTPTFAGLIASGNVGIGTASPAHRLEVVGPAANGSGNEGLWVDNNGVQFAVRRDAGGGGDLQVGTPNGHNLYLMTNGASRISVAATGGVRFNTYGAGTLVTDSSGNITASSDASLKTVTGSFTRGLADVLKLTPRTYHWSDKSGMNTEDENVGFIAQEVLGAVPEAVGRYRTTESDVDGKKTKKREKAELLTLSDRPIIAALVNAVKELKAENDALSDRLSKLEGKK